MTRWLETLWYDVRHGFRALAKSRAMTAIAVLSIACGTGANVAMFSAVDALLLRPLPVRDASGLITVGVRASDSPSSISVASYPDFFDIRSRSHGFSALVAYNARRAGVSLSASAPKQVKFVTSVSGNFFDELGIPLHLGRGFLPEEDRVPGRDAVAVISYGMWKQLFVGDQGVLGREIVIAGTVFTVIGVTAESFTGIEPDSAGASAYVPLAMWAEVMNVPGRDPFTARDFRALTVKGRLRFGVALDEARAELDAIGKELERTYPATNAGQRLVAQTELQWRFARTPHRAGLVLLLSVLSLTVLLVACANVAALLTSRAPLRAQELAVRLAIGAGRGRLVAQLLTENALIALAGGLGGLLVGYAGITLMGQVQFPTDIIAPPVMRLDARALAFTLAVALASVVLFGLGPALATTRIDLSNSFRVTDTGGRRQWWFGGRSQLVALQVALSLVVLTVAAISLQTFATALEKGPGFRTTRIAKLSIDASQARYAGGNAAQFFERVEERARELPGVTSVGLTSAMPLWGFELVQIVPDAVRGGPGGVGVSSPASVVNEGYFRTMEIPIVAGRAFGETDTAAAPLVAIVNETAAQRYFPGVDPVGRRFRMSTDQGPSVEIVGVARNSIYSYPAEAPQTMVYFPHRQQPRANMVLLAQTAGPSTETLESLPELVQSLDPAVPVYDAQTIERFYYALATSLAGIILAMVWGIGAMGVAITLVGLYGLVSYSVNRRTREIGLRIALGATYGRLLCMFVTQGLVPAWIGLAVGSILSTATARALPSFVPFSESYDGLALFGLVPVLIAVTALAAFLPARRAATVDATVALRQD
jgi:macrolide transport system ATP-binding/permease protein